MNIDRHDPGDALERRIDASLRRLFAAPSTLGTLDSLVARARGLTGRKRAGGFPLVFLAAAAALLLLVWLIARRSAGEAEPLRLALAPIRSPAAAPPPVGPLEECPGEPGRVRAPDIPELYREMDVCQRAPALVACGERDRLAETLTRTYGEEVRLRPEANGLLHGPFSSPEWPTGTILTGLADERTAVLVAERDSTLACCISMQLPEDSGLRLFTWRVGELVLTEITPLEEPRLLEYFE